MKRIFHTKFMLIATNILIFVALTLLPSTSYAISESFEISTEFVIASDITAADSNTMKPGKPALGFDGTNYLIVSCRDENSSTNIFGVLLSVDGLILKTFSIADLNPVYGCTNKKSSVAFDGTNYLVVFIRTTNSGTAEIAGSLVSPSGVPINGTEGFTIISNVSNAPVVAYDGTNYLVVSGKYSNDTLHDIYGAMVSTSGQILSEFLIFSAPGGQVMSSVAFDGTNYFVIWSDTRIGSPVGPDADIYGSRVTPGGTVLDPEGIPISTAQGMQANPQIIFDGNNYFAVWDDDRSDPGAFDPAFDIFGTRITPNGIVLDGPTDTGGIAINSRPGPQQHPVVSFDGTKYIVSWEMSYFYDPPVGIYTARVSTDGILIDGPPEIGGILISQPSSYASRLVWPSSFSSGNNFLLTWIDNREVSGEAKDIYGVLIYPISQDASPYYDTFNVSNIDLSKWQDERGEIIGGKLWLENQSAGGWSSTTLKMLTDNITNHFSSQVSISNSSFTIGDSSVAVKVGGIYYNDTYDVSSFYNEWEGNIYADIRLQLTPDGYLYARAVVVRYNNSNGSSKTTLFARAFSQAISFNTEYELSIELRGSSFIFKCNEETINYQISTPIHPSNKLNRGLIAMVYADEGESGYVKGSFDDVCIGKSCSKATFLPAVLLLLL